MPATRDDHRVVIDGVEVAVMGESGLVEPTWRLLIDGAEAESVKASGKFTLSGALPNGSSVVARINQHMFGSTEVSVEHDGHHVVRFTGFVL
jgi:hypothetical protein